VQLHGVAVVIVIPQLQKNLLAMLTKVKLTEVLFLWVFQVLISLDVCSNLSLVTICQSLALM